MNRLNQHFETFQATVGTTVTQIVPQRFAVDEVTIENLGTETIFVGAQTVDQSTGFVIPGVVGASLTIRTSDSIWAVATATASLSIIRTFS